MASTESQKNAELLLLAAYRGGVNDPKELANFMGQMQVESQGFTKAHESLNYSAERLLAVFPGRNGMDTLKEAKAIVAGGQERIAEAIYGGKWGEGLGNKPNSGDSFDFRGRGFVQLTGRSNYEHYGKAIGLDLAKHHFQRSKLKFFRMRDRQRCTEPRRTGRARNKGNNVKLS